ncbi:AcrB/AcrD/AcrF family protein [Aquisediminimonas sediminicola]|uniref:AcrB/AcrD/AcrF family protein n=1 Tax=Alteraquisediminimonas sediminicola TaxID=2676787 RepID=UPI001C8D10BA|nr:AcrB/AcrD/AcrF family protein [Aquisediminimonas sediminicola]
MRPKSGGWNGLIGGRHWYVGLALCWLGLAAWMIHFKWGAILQFGLGDTDDNLRYLQVRDWLNGQGWFDLRQHRLAPPEGANLHWSRLIDLPIAGLYLLASLFMGSFRAWQLAVTLAPMIPMLVAMAALTVMMRRLIGRCWWPAGLVMLFGSMNLLYMWMPLRIDHHGWQLALLAWVMAGMTDPLARRGGLTVGIASALSLAIGLEFVHFLLLAAALAVFDWGLSAVSAVRLRMHGLSLGVGALIMWLVFASYDNRLAVCDALSPVWLLVMIGGGGVMVMLSMVADQRPWLRLMLATGCAVPIALLFALLFPHCLGSPEGLTPALRSLWFENIREVKSVMTRDWKSIMAIMTVPVVGLIGAGFGWYREKDDRLAARWRALAILSAVAVTMLFWQTRAAASAQLIGILGAGMLAATLISSLRSLSIWLRLPLIVAVLALLSGVGGQYVMKQWPSKPVSKSTGKFNRTVAQADRECQSAKYLRQLTSLPSGIVLTHVDFGPRLIAMTHHQAIAGPYHRNGKAIIDVMRFFRGSSTQAKRIAGRWHVDYVLVCPGMPESTIYKARSPDGFYMKLLAGKSPNWLEAVALPTPTPYRLWRVHLPKSSAK